MSPRATTCNTCGHVTWHTAGIRACGHCDRMGCWPRVRGDAVSVDRAGQTPAENPPYDWASDGPWTIED